MSGKGKAFIQRTAAAGKPFLLEIATFAPHSPFTPANQDLNDFPGLTAPRTPAYDKLPANAPAWLAGNGPLTAAEKSTMDTNFRKRAQSVQAVDRLIGNLRAQLDLAPTFQRIGGADVGSAVDGRSLLGLAQGDAAPNWRAGALIEHHGPNQAADDPDAQTARNGSPTTYNALRTATYTHVEYSTGEREYYNRVADPNQLNNIAGELSAARRTALHDALTAYRNCHDHEACWTAGHVPA